MVHRLSCAPVLPQRRNLLIIASIAIGGVAAYLWTTAGAGVSIERYAVERRLAPANAVSIDAPHLAATATQQWDATAIATAWDAVGGATSATRRSPPLAPSNPHDLFAIIITLSPTASTQRAVLLWSSQAAL